MVTDYIEYERKNIRTKALPFLSSSGALFCDIILHFKKYGVACSFSDYFDVAAGSDLLRNLTQEIQSEAEVTQLLNTQLKKFYAKAHSCFLYKPYPQIVVP